MGGEKASCFSREHSQDSFRFDVRPRNLIEFENGEQQEPLCGFLLSSSPLRVRIRCCGIHSHSGREWPLISHFSFSPSAIPGGPFVGPVIKFPDYYYGCQQHSKIPVFHSSLRCAGRYSKIYPSQWYDKKVTGLNLTQAFLSGVCMGSLRVFRPPKTCTPPSP